LGVRAESIHALDFGYAVPRLRVEYRHEFSRAGDAYIQYADQLGGPLYRLPSAGGPRDSMVLGLGSDFILRDGLSLSVEYQLSHSFSNASTHALRLRLNKEFDVRGLPHLLSDDPELVHDEPINVQVEAGAAYDDNVTRAKAGADRMGDHSYTVNISKGLRQPLSENSRLMWTGTLGGEKFRQYNGLSRVSLGGEVEYQYRASSEFNEPTFGAFARLTGEAFESELRDGYRFSAGVSLRQALTDRINFFGALSHNRRHASSEVFSTIDNSMRGNVDYALSDKGILYLGAEYRRGDIVSTGRPSLENATVADVFVQDDAYPGGQLFSYRFRGSTTLLTMGYNLAVGPRDSIDFSWRLIRSTPGLRPSFVTSPRSYRANQLSVVYLMRF
ncbi:MAG: autotransporter domain-containing protein, partial [Burkholderiaceae bacterium]